jgi:hypothetical protein
MEQNIKDTRASLIKQRDSALQGTSAYFSRISPNVLQSQEANYKNEVNTNANLAQTRLGTELNTGDYRNRTDLAGELSDVGRLVRGYQGLGESRVSAEEQALINKNQAVDRLGNESLANKVVDPSYSTEGMSEYGDIMNTYSNYMNSLGQDISSANQPQSVSSQLYDYWGNPITAGA